MNVTLYISLDVPSVYLYICTIYHVSPSDIYMYIAEALVKVSYTLMHVVYSVQQFD